MSAKQTESGAAHRIVKAVCPRDCPGTYAMRIDGGARFELATN
jgi:hypothetical protein